MIKTPLISLALTTLVFSQTLIAAESVDQTQSFKGEAKVSVNVQRGDVIFKPWDKNEISVKGELDELSEGLTFTVNGSHVVIEDKMPRQYNGSNKEGSQLTIMLPQRIKLQAEGVSANYRIDGFNGKMDISSVSGDIKATQLQDKVMIHTVSGDISSRELNGKVMLETVSGEIKDTDSAGKVAYRLVSGELTASSRADQVSVELVSGDASLALGDIESLSIKTVSGDIELSINSLKDKAKLGSVSGDIDVHFTAKVNASFDINGGPSGKITNKLTNDKVSKEQYSPQTYLKFQAGDGSATLNASTISGNIELSN
ncbi:Conserved hypothetical protein [Shewanella piezotolerans WP3]|uniref:DUF4097 domain-containing protein n=1 Tax=Shewanella piezotolerans (strain WP3 / JCM 13877) TaxID=225849 RepID=B8CQS3_SHEPW|nr:DUF4097 family beta strand repeat-containing protein [Shewanella piezotolerans]ACJ30539.1 Conserved hypothetical protein [Shewanella piezotolerans WP3]